MHVEAGRRDADLAGVARLAVATLPPRRNRIGVVAHDHGQWPPSSMIAGFT